MIRTLQKITIAGAIALAACGQKQTAVDAGPHPVATIQEIMQSIVDPAADMLWDSVSTTITLQGTEEKQPRSDEEWIAVRHQSIQLIEAANLLVAPDRLVAAHGKTLEDAHVAGINTPAVIEKLIADDPAAFAAYARALQEAALATLNAIDQRDVPALIEAGGYLDHACEQCHLRYWYPNAQKPPQE